MLRFDGRVAIVTGAGRGIGAAHARMLADRGAAVVVNDLDDNEVADRIVSAGGRACGVVGSITDPDVRERLVAGALDHYGRVDVVVNNAGMGRPHPVAELDAQHLRLELEVHVVAALMLTSAAWPHLARSGDGAVVFTTSGVGLFGKEGAVGYAVAKAGLVGATKVLAAEGARSGIRVNAVAPMAATRMARDVFGDLTERLDPSYVAAALTWLAHPSCTLSGAIVSAAGGRVAEVRVSVGRGQVAATPEDLARSWPAIRADEHVEPADALAEADLVAEVLAEAAPGRGQVP